MLIHIFKSILLMSAVGSLLSVFLLSISPLTRKLFSPKWQYYIWLIVLIVMLFPIRSVIPVNSTAIPTLMPEQTENIAAEAPKADSQAVIQQSEKPSNPKIVLPQNLLYCLASIWLFGAVATSAAKLIKYKLFLRAISKNSDADTSITDIPKRLKVRKTDMLNAPLLVGLFKPTLFLPSIPLSQSDMNYILLHELTHYKRGDLWYKWLATAVLSIH